MIAALTLAGGSPAQALSFEDIAGKWCTGIGTALFTRDKLTVTLASSGQKIELKVEGYEFDETQITVKWVTGQNKHTSTPYRDFSADRRMMVQPATSDGPRRELHRC